MSLLISQDIWMSVFDSAADDHGTSALKTCSLVCKKWRAGIQSRLLSSVIISKHSEQLDEAEGLKLRQSIGHFVRKLALLGNWTTVPAEFNKITELQLRYICSTHIGDVHKMLCSISPTVQILKIADSEIQSLGVTSDIALLDAGALGRLGSDHNARDSPSVHLALCDLEVSCYSSHVLAENVLFWLVRTPTVGCLRRLKITVSKLHLDLFAQLCSWMSDPACRIEKLELVFEQSHGLGLSECTLLHSHDS
jgi:hypothetical protein